MSWASWASAASRRHAGGTAALSPWPCSLQAIRGMNPMGHPLGAQADWHHGLAAETCHTMAPEWREGVISWHLHPGHWLHCWSVWNTEYMFELLMQIILKGVWVGMIMESIWLSHVMQLCELSSLFPVRHLSLVACLGWCWIFLEKNSKTYLSCNDLYCI